MSKLTKESEKLRKLREQQEKLQARIDKQHALESTSERKKLHKRQYLIGAHVVWRMKHSEDAGTYYPHSWTEIAAQMEKDRFLIRDTDRRAFDLPPLPKRSKPANQEQ